MLLKDFYIDYSISTSGITYWVICLIGNVLFAINMKVGIMGLWNGIKMLDRVYKFKWLKRKTKSDGCSCSRCSESFPKNSTMYVLYNKWNHATIEIICPTCYQFSSQIESDIEL